MRKIKNILYYTIIIGLVGYILILVFVPDSMTEIVGFRSFFVLSNSMEGVINEEDLVVIKQVDEEDIEEGDIITFYIYLDGLGAEGFVTHYVGEIVETENGKVYYTHGTRTPDGIYDEWIDESGDPLPLTYDYIEGEYLFRIPYLGYVKNALTNPLMLGLITLNGTVIFVLVSYLKNGKEDEESEEI
jgi:signal peptidase